MKIETEVRTIGLCDRSKKSRVYIFPEGETILENFMKRITGRSAHPHALYRKEVMPAVLKEMGLPEDTKFRWSQYAGCSCPCSPGYIIEGDDMDREAFVTVSMETENAN